MLPIAAAPNPRMAAPKSTPIAQLPYGGGGGGAPPPPAPPPAYVNEQHRQMIASAQQAAQAYSPPQPSTHDIAADDDQTINDVLGALQAPSLMQQQPQLQLPGAGPPASAAEQLYMEQLYRAAGAPPPYASLAPGAPPPPPAAAAAGALGGLLPFSADDLRVAAVAVALFVAASALPILPLFAKYVPIDSLPYGELLLRAAVFGVALLVVRRFVV